MKKISPSINTYIKKVSERHSVGRPNTERVINTQIALLFGDLAVTGKSECFLGTLTYEEGMLNLEPNDFIIELIEGKVDPTIILREIFENV